MDFTVLCSKCRKKVSTGQVRLQADKSYVCFSCAGYAPSGAKESKETAESAPVQPRKTKYQCDKCKYEFYLKEGRAKKCPYCNGENIREKQFDAQRLLDSPVEFSRDD